MSQRWKSKMRMRARVLWLFGLMFGLSYFVTNVIGITAVYAGSRQNHAAVPVTNCGSYGSILSPGTLGAALATATAGDTISFACAGSGSTTIYVPVINITFNLTLQWQSGETVILDGDGSNAVFNVTGNTTTLTLDHLTINGGHANISGGAISIGDGSTVHSTNDTFSSNTTGIIAASAGTGGAIDVGNGSTFTSTSDAFTGNTASAGIAIGTNFGGAIYNHGGTVSSTTDTFTGNTAGNGGAIYTTSGYTSTGDTFTSNSATNGGAIYSNDGTVTLVGSTFGIGNSATASGGAIYNEGGTITGTTGITSFSNNTAVSGGAITNAGGGTVTLTGSTFSNNGTTATGGAITNSGSTLTLTNGTFSGNSTNTSGGAIYNDGNSASLTTNNVTFDSNIAPGSGNGGAIYNNGGTVSNTTGTFINNHAANGGAIASTGGTVTLAGGTFGTSGHANIATTNGGAIYNNGGTLTSTANTVSFTGNTAASGGAIYNTSSLSSSINKLRGIVPHTNHLTAVGTITLAGGTFTSNAATVNGGAIYNDGGTASSTTSNVTFNANTTTENGGAIYNAGAVSSTTDTFTDNAAANGGAIANNGSSLTLAGGTFGTSDHPNSATTNGGAIYNNGGIITSTAGSVSFTGNTAANGGAIYSSGGTFNITYATFSGNSAAAGGGAVTNDAGFVNVASSTFVNNSAVDGGAIYFTNDTAHGTVKNSTFTGNFVTTQSTIAGGGTIEVSQGILDLVSDTIAGNHITAQGATQYSRGAGLYNRGGTISVLGSILTNNIVNYVNNSGPQQYTNNCSGTISDKGFNIESGAECEFTKSANNTSTPDQQNVTDAQLKLSALASNGGPTQTMALGNGSVAINRGANDNNCLSTDQRDYDRVQHCDIGAFEFRAAVITLQDITVDIAKDSSTPGNITSIPVTWPDIAAKLPDSSDAATVTCSPASGSIFYIGVTVVTCTAKDAANPATEASGTFTVTVKNSNNVPTLSVPSSISVQATSSNGANVTYSVTAEDGSYPSSQLTLSCVDHADKKTTYPTGADVSATFPIGITQVDCTVNNPAGKTTSASFTVEVIDYPTVNVPQTITVSATSVRGRAVDFTVSAKDTLYASNLLTITCSPDSGSMFPIGTTQVTCTATNPSNNSHSESFNVVVQDIPWVNTPDWPNRTLVVDATSKDGASVDLSQYVTASTPKLARTQTISCWLDSDENKINIYPPAAQQLAVKFRSHDNFSLPVFPITLEGNGTQVDCQATNQPPSGPGFTSPIVSFFVKVHDTLLPTLNVSDTITVNATTPKGAVVNYSVVASDPVYSSSALTMSCWNDANVRTTYPTGFSVSATFPIGTTQVDCLVTNPSGGFATSNFTVVVQNKLQPTLHLPSTITADATSAQGAIVTYNVSATDPIYSSDLLTLSCSPDSGSTFPLGTTVVHCKVANPLGTTVYGSFNVVVQNNLHPTLHLPSTITVDATSAQGATVTYDVSATDPVYVANQLTLSCSPASGSTFPIGITAVNCTATNPLGTTVPGTFNVVVQNHLQLLLTLPSTITVGATSASGAVVTYSVSASDPVYAANQLTLSCLPASGSTFPIGTTAVNCTATNPLGTTMPGTFNVVVSKLAPTLTLPPTITLNATSPQGVAVTYNVSISDPIFPTNQLTLSCLPASGSTFPIGNTTVSCTVTNPLGMTASGVFNVVVQNNRVPTLALPPTITVDATSASGAVVTYNVSASDPVYAANQLTLSCLPASGSTFPIGTTAVNCTATNPANTTVPGTFNVVVQNKLHPTLHLPLTITVDATSAQGATVTYNVSATDPVYAANQLTLSCSPASGAIFPIGTTTVSCTATNPLGTTVPGTFNVVVQNHLQLLLTLPPTITVGATSASGAVVTYSVSASDPVYAANQLTLSCLPASGSTFPIGTTAVNCTATNPLGTTVPGTFNVVVSKLLPTLTLPPTITLNATSPQGVAVTYNVSISDPIFPTNQLTLSCLPASGSTFPIGTTTVSCTVTNPLGTTASRAFRVRVRDAGDQMADMIRSLPALHLQTSVQSQLNTSLSKALSAFNTNRSDTSKVRGLLSSFITTTQSLRNNGLTPSQADQLIANARAIQIVLGG